MPVKPSLSLVPTAFLLGCATTARFNSASRLARPDVWKVVFDKGSPL